MARSAGGRACRSSGLSALSRRGRFSLPRHDLSAGDERMCSAAPAATHERRATSVTIRQSCYSILNTAQYHKHTRAHIFNEAAQHDKTETRPGVWARYQFCRIYFKICRRGAPAKISKKIAVGPDFHQDLSNLRRGVGGWVRLGLLGLLGLEG